MYNSSKQCSMSFILPDITFHTCYCQPVYVAYHFHFIGFAVSLASLSFWVSNLVVAQLTPILLASPLQSHGTFYILAGLNLAGFLFVLLTVPETKVIQHYSTLKI